MGNAIRLGIARVGLAISQCTRGNRTSHRTACVILILGLDKAGKTTVASLISKSKEKPVSDTTYVPTNGFSIYEVKSKGSVTKLYDLGGSESIRELWNHYYSDAHGFIYVIDSASSPKDIKKSAQVFAQLLQDERVKGKPILILANKQDVEGSLSELELTNQMDIVRLVNTAKCLTRLDTSSATNLTQLEGSDNGINLGFRWLTSFIKWHWADLNDRVEHDSLVERSREKAKFETKREQAPEIAPVKPKRDESGKSIKSYKSCQTLPARRLDPEGGNDEIMEDMLVHPGDDSSEDVDMEDGMLDSSNSVRQVPEILIVEAKVQVHKEDSSSLSLPEPSNLELLELPPSPILESRESFANNVSEVPDESPSVEDSVQAEVPQTTQPAVEGEPKPVEPETVPTAKSASRVGPPVPRRMKVFRNKTAPLIEGPPIYQNSLTNNNKR